MSTQAKREATSMALQRKLPVRSDMSWDAPKYRADVKLLTSPITRRNSQVWQSQLLLVATNHTRFGASVAVQTKGTGRWRDPGS